MCDSHTRFGGKKNDGQLYTTVGEGAPMNKRMVHSTWFLSALTLVAVSIAGCGRETINVPDTTPPFVSSTSPALGAAGVAVGAPISVTFSKLVNCPTASTFTVAVAGGGAAVTPTSVTCFGSAVTTATFTPSSALVLHTLYTATITGATDLVGNVMASPYAWNFEAVAGPSAVFTFPVTGASSVPFGNQVISATFPLLPTQDPDYAGALLNCSTVTASTFTVTAPAPVGTVTGTVACSSATGIVTFTAPLVANTVYTATLTTGVQNAAGTPLASSVVSTFTTDTVPTVSTTIPANTATGVLLTQAIGVTFSKAMNCSTLSTTFTVTAPAPLGTVAGSVSCTGSGTGALFTPSNLLANNTVYTAKIAAGATDLAGTPLGSGGVANPWTFLTVPAPTAPTVIATVPTPTGVNGVATSQAVSATFSEALNPSTIISPATNFTLTNVATGVAVTGTVTYAVAGSVATFTPTNPTPLAASTNYAVAIKTGIQDLAGNALASQYNWTFTTAALPDTTKPTVNGENPVGGATGVPTNQIVTATFSKAMNANTITATSPATFTLTTGTPAVAVLGLVAYSGVGNTLTFTPTAALPAGVYTATITNAATDLSGNALTTTGGLPLSWSFTVGTATAPSGPYITLTSPLDTATSVPLNQAVSATFSTAMNPLTFTSSTFTLTSSTGAVITGTYLYNPSTLVATFTPSASTPLLANTTYTADITTGVTDSSTPGNPLVSGLVPNPWFFTTAGSPGPPAVVLGTASLFGDFGGTAGMTNDAGNETVINGDIGTTAVSTGVVNFHDTTVNTLGVYECSYSETPIDTGGQVNGTIYTAPGTSIPTAACPNEGTAVTSAIAAQAKQDTLTAYNSMSPASMPGGTKVETCPAPQCTGTNGNADELGNRILRAGVYMSTPGDYQITTGPLTLDAAGNPNATWVFQMPSSTLKVGNASGPQSVILVNGAQAANVFWYVGSAATFLPAGGTFYGTVIASAGVTTGTAGVTTLTTINGRLLSTVGAVTLSNTVINVPAP